MLRKRPVSFGNPALGVYHGTVYTQALTIDPRPVVEGALDVRCLVAMVDVPPEQVPEGVLNLARAHRPWIHHVRIVIAAASTTATIEGDSNMSDVEEAPSRTYLVLIQLSSESAAQVIVKDLDGRPYTTLDETQVCSVQHVVAWQGQDGVSLMSPYFATETQSSATGGLEMLEVPSSIHHQYSEDYHCPVCLEHLELQITASGEDGDETVPILTTVCNHSFHMDCFLQWQESPCPVCRYDHSGLNEALSRCETCGTTEHNFVCLICGRVSCANAGHAQQHYDTTLHAYALDTESQHVWDFAGQGYVHRLLQNKDDGKLVEVSDPSNSSSQERSAHPGLSNAQEGEWVHRKLEGFASQYYTLLKSQLEQQRIFYESRLEEVRREYSRKHQGDDNSTNQTELVGALRQERHQLSQRFHNLQTRRSKLNDEVAFLRHMNESLSANKGPLQHDLERAERELTQTRQMFQDLLPPLQEKVTRLMLQLEGGG